MHSPPQVLLAIVALAVTSGSCLPLPAPARHVARASHAELCSQCINSAASGVSFFGPLVMLLVLLSPNPFFICLCSVAAVTHHFLCSEFTAQSASVADTYSESQLLMEWL
jgi:hypothetical protein